MELVLDDRELGEWAEATPEELLKIRSGLTAKISSKDAWKVLRYGTMQGHRSYDDIAHRIAAATPYHGAVPLQTIQKMMWERTQDSKSARYRKLERIQEGLRHRAIDIDPPEGKLHYEVRGNTFELFTEQQTASGVSFEEQWTLGISHPPGFLLEGATSRDASRCLNQEYQWELPDTAWVPLNLLIETGRLHRRQHWEDSLTTKVEPGVLYLFISHRWRSPENPDPDGTEARLIAWQLLFYFYEAIIIANARGLHEPRQFAASLGFPIGLSGAELSESLIVNVLRFALDDQSLKLAVGELDGIDNHMDNKGLSAAENDDELQTLRELLDSRPTLRALMERVRLWYDYSCLPQMPRSKDEQAIFERGLDSLNTIQALGLTVILLDEPETYLSRAWCTMEAIFGNIGKFTPKFLHSTFRLTTSSGNAEDYFLKVMQDRPHLVRRGVLDTLVFKIQTPEECFHRLGIALNDSTDLPFVFGRLAASQSSSVHVDRSSIITGTLPLAHTSDSQIILLPKSGQLVQRSNEPLSLDWSDALTLPGIDGRQFDLCDSHKEFTSTSVGDSRCHIIVIGGCEGDAVLMADWARTHRSEVEQTLETNVVAISWLSNDIAPVGHMISGQLDARVSSANFWLIVSLESHFNHGELAARILFAAESAGLERGYLLVDSASHNLHRLYTSMVPQGDSPERVAMEELDLNPIQGGVFAAALSDKNVQLFRNSPPKIKPILLEDVSAAPEHLQVIVINTLFEGKIDDALEICREFPRSIYDNFHTWSTIPEEILDNPPSVRAYGEALMTIGNIMGELGYPELLESLVGGDDNPIQGWNISFQEASQHTQSGRFAESNHVLHQLLADLEVGKGGSAVDDLKPKVLGMLGANLFHLGLVNEAREMTQTALDTCHAVGDAEGVAAYQKNLQYMHLAEGPLKGVDEDVSRAQLYSDQGRYKESIEILAPLLQRSAGDLECKINGLLGANYHWCGDREAADRYLGKAVALAEAGDDIEAYRIYLNNLEIVRKNELADVASCENADRRSSKSWWKHLFR